MANMRSPRSLRGTEHVAVLPFAFESIDNPVSWPGMFHLHLVQQAQKGFLLSVVSH
jgi:hypothetical protein